MINDDSTIARFRWRTGFLHLLVFGAIVLVPPALVRLRPLSDESESMDVPAEIDKIQQARPEFFLIGNSMLDTRIDVALLNRLSGREFYKIIRHGSASATWYLFLKNVALAADTPARGVIVFFKRRELTWTRYRTDGRQSVFLQSLRKTREPVVDRLIASEGSWDFFKWLYPIREGVDFDHKLRSLAMDLTPLGLGKRARSAEMDGIFALGNLVGNDSASAMAPDDDTDEAEDVAKPARFDGDPGHSFLPHMLDVARKHSVKMYFFQVKTRPDENGNVKQTPGDLAYLRDLRAYLEQNGACLIDEVPDRSIPVTVYSDGSHIRPGAMDWYTRKFWQRMGSILE